jgi:hypothetical protein
VNTENRVDFIDEMLKEAEVRDEEQRIAMDRLRADATLAAIGVLECEMGEVEELCNQEIRLIEEYRCRELERLEMKRSWLLFNLEAWVRATSEKTIRLIHGVCKIRKGRDKVAIVSMEEFLKVGPGLKLVRTVPERREPDMRAIIEHIKRTGEIPSGVEFIRADTRFSYTINGGQHGNDEEAEVGAADEPNSDAEPG